MSPDAYTPSAAGSAAGASGAPTVSSGGTVTAANWRKMQLQGCVFLPAAGYSFNNTTFQNTTYGWYMSSSTYGTGQYQEYYKFIFGFQNKDTNVNETNKNTKSSVRLVHVL